MHGRKHAPFRFFLPPLWVLLLLVLLSGAAAKKLNLPDNLDDVVDNEEDDSWVEWGKEKTPEPPEGTYKDGLLDFTKLKEYSAARLKGPAFAFVKLRLDPDRTKQDAVKVAWRWSNLMTSGMLAGKFMAMDPHTLYVNIHDERTIPEVRDFVLDQPESYEMMVGEEHFRREGDPPLEQVMNEKRETVWGSAELLQDRLLGIEEKKAEKKREKAEKKKKMKEEKRRLKEERREKLRQRATEEDSSPDEL